MFDWLFGSGRQTNYDDTNKLYGQFNDAQGAATSFYNDNIAGKDWNALDTATKTSLASQYGDLNSKAGGLADQYTTTSDLFSQEEKANKNNFFGNGLLGAILNPFAQTFDAGMDAISGTYEGRDVASDLGALGESALTFLPGVGMVGKAGKVGKALTSVPGLAATGAGFGGLEALRQGGSETQLQDVLSQGAMGAAFGGGIPLAGKLLKNRGSKVLQKGMVSRGMEPEAISQTMGAIPNRALYSSAVRSFVPKSTFGKVALGGGALYGGSQLMNSMNQPQQNPASGGQITDEQLYNYLISQGLA
jgi:hypothetical protein